MEATSVPQIKTNIQKPVQVRPRPRLAPLAAPASRLNMLQNVPPAVSLGSSSIPAPVLQLVSAPGPGEALTGAVQNTLENSLAVDLSAVRVHSDNRVRGIVGAVGARAFTFGKHIFLGARERATDLALMAHEVIHVVQQQGTAPVVQMYSDTQTSNIFEQEAQHGATNIQHGVTTSVQNYTGEATVQPDLVDDGADLLERGVSAVVEWGEDKIWDLLNQFAPELVPILRQGVFEWLKEKISNAVQSIFDTLSAPVRAVTGVVQTLSSHFGDLLDWMREAAAKIARGDCSSVSEAAEKIQKVVEGLASPVIDKLKQLASKVGGFFSGLWERFGAPAWDFLKRIGGQAWEKIQQFAVSIWDKTKPIRDLAARAWTWFKNKLGIGDGPDGQNGLLQWAQEKAGAAWDWVKARIEPFKKPLMVVGGVLVMLSPAGPIIAIGAAAVGLMRGIRWIRQHLNTPDGVVRQRGVLQSVIIPAIMGAVNGVTSTLTSAANFVKDKLNQVVSGLGEAAGAIGGSILSFAAGIVQWIADQFRGLANWATEKVSGLADWVNSGLERLHSYLQPIFDVLGRIATVVGNIMQLPFLVAGRLWNAIPACIRDPFVNFFIPLILSQISFFRELVGTPEAWARTRNEVMTIVRQIFVNHDLIGAMKNVFRLLLRALNVPVQLAITVLNKAATAWDAVLDKPIEFLKNILRAMGRGFRLFFGNILSHLMHGVAGWIFGELKDVGIQPPSSWTDLGAVFKLVLSVLGISLGHIFELLGQRLTPSQVGIIRGAVRFLTGAWEWLSVAMREGPAGIWRMIMERLRDLGNRVIQAAVNWIMERIVARVTARLLSMLDPTGIGAAINAIVSLYQAIQTVIRYARQILEIVNSVLDTVLNIAQGVLDPAAQMMETAMHNAMPVIIAFLANQAGLSGLGARMREIVANIRERVDNAILWLIDKAKAGIDALLRMVGLGGNQAVGQQPGQGGEKRNIDRHVTIMGEQHTLRVHVENGETIPLMASEGWGDFRQNMTLIENYQTERLTSQGEPQKAADLRKELDKVKIREGEIETRARAANRQALQTGHPPRNLPGVEIWEEGLTELDQMLDAIAVIFNFNQGVNVKIGDHIIYKNKNERMKVTSVNNRLRNSFGIYARTLDARASEEFLSYRDFGNVWEIAGLYPGFIGFNWGGTEGSTRTITVTKAKIGSGSGVASGVNPPGISLFGTPTIWEHRGHLIANRLGGPGDIRNVVAMTAAVNLTSGANGIKSIENPVAADIVDTSTNGPLGAVYEYTATPNYNKSVQPAPTSITVTAKRLYPTLINPAYVPASVSLTNI